MLVLLLAGLLVGMAVAQNKRIDQLRECGHALIECREDLKEKSCDLNKWVVDHGFTD